MKPSITNQTAHNADLRQGDCIRIVHWLGRETYAALNPYGQVLQFTDDPTFGSEIGLRCVQNRNMVDMPIKILAIEYPLAMLSVVHPGKPEQLAQLNVTSFECVKIPAHYYEAVKGRAAPSFSLAPNLDAPIEWPPVVFLYSTEPEQLGLLARLRRLLP